ncbi:MAG TPA: HgcAB-associated protein [Dehalococcoidales bacterium]|nr:HgcAB-associated protein [Dehalococcoidales bacterium]
MGKEQNKSCCGNGNMACCQVESVVTVDERGQMVLPKELREKAGIKPGDKMAVISWDKEGKSCCFILMKTDQIAEMVKSTLGPLSKEIFK